MSDNLDRKLAVPKYFLPTPKKPKLIPLLNKASKSSLIIGIIISVFSLIVIVYVNNYLGGLVGLLVGAFLIWSWYSDNVSKEKAHEAAYQQKMSEYQKEYDKTEPKPSDTQMDKWLTEDIEELKKDALEKLDLNDEDMTHDPGDPIMIIGPSSNTQIGIGKDKLIRFSIYDILFVYLTEYHLAAYKCTLDFASKIRTSESTQEYHYTDVVSVSTKTGSDLALTINGETKSLANYQQFALSVASGESIKVATPVSFVDQWVGVINDGKLPDSGADKAIRVIRSRLREKKGGTIG